MPMELRPLVKKLGLQKTEIGGVDVRSGRIGDRNVVAIVTGMGTKLAREGTERLLDAVSVNEVVVVGITGAVDNETPIGTLILPEVVVDSATGKEYRPAVRAEGTPKGKMWTTDGLTTDLNEIAALRAKGVVSLDMETAAIAESCGKRVGYPVVGLPGDQRPCHRRIDQRGGVPSEAIKTEPPNKAAVARYFLKHPTHVARMAELAKGRQAGH